MQIILSIVTFLISAISFLAGLWIGSKIPPKATEALLKKLKPKRAKDIGVVQGMTPKEAKVMKDKEFRKQFPQVG